MHERRFSSDPNALTQPIPVVHVPPPARSNGVRTVVAPPYVHRFGNLAWYLLARFAANVLDVFGVAFVVATFGYRLAERGFVLFAGRDEAGFLTLAGVSFGIAFALEVASEALLGTTLGKLVFALQVRRRDGRRAGAGRAFVRTLLRPIDVVFVGPLLALVTPRHQRLGDLLAGAVVGGSRRAAASSLLGLLLVAAIVYAQTAVGGGLTSAIGVAAETANYAPAIYARLTGAPSPVPSSSGTSNV